MMTSQTPYCRSHELRPVTALCGLECSHCLSQALFTSSSLLTHSPSSLLAAITLTELSAHLHAIETQKHRCARLLELDSRSYVNASG